MEEEMAEGLHFREGQNMERIVGLGFKREKEERRRREEGEREVPARIQMGLGEWSIIGGEGGPRCLEFR